jgi:hypothetical protein
MLFFLASKFNLHQISILHIYSWVNFVLVYISYIYYIPYFT